MADPIQVEQEIRQYLTEDSNLTTHDKFNYLMGIFNKHLELNKMEFLIQHKDVESIFDYAKGSMKHFAPTMNISRKKMSHVEYRYVIIMDSLLTFLNRNHLLRRLVKFNFTE